MSNLKMKSSGIDWIGDIPAHWAVKRVKDISKIRKGKAVATFFEKSIDMLPSIDTNFLRGRDNVVYCSSGVKVFSEKVLILWDGANAGELFFNKNIGYLGSTFGVFNTKLNNSFWFYYLKGIEKYSRDNLTGMGIPHVDSNVLKQTIALVPPKDQQVAIANYLDIETSKIDRKILILEQKFDKLEEYKKSVIFETVTKGLDSNVGMKDSGIDWIGDIPTHWEVKRVKEFVRLSQGLSVNSSEYVDESDVVLIRMGNIKKGGKIDLNHKNVYLPSKFKKSSKQYLLKENDIIIAMTDMSPNLDFLGVPAKLLGLNEDLTYIVNQRVGKLNFKTKDLNIDYFKYYLMTPLAKNQFKAEGLGTIQGNMSDSHFSNLFFIQPSWNEQNDMVAYLNTICSQIDKKLEIIKNQIELLKEYKQTIIYEAVTGKMEIL